MLILLSYWSTIDYKYELESGWSVLHTDGKKKKVLAPLQTVGIDFLIFTMGRKIN